MSGRVLLVRHCEVHARYAGLCYGQSDVELSEAGRIGSHDLAERLAELPVTRVIHSGLQRTSYLADRLAKRTGLISEVDERLRERSFGAWELTPWEAIHEETGSAMMGMLTDPAVFRPGGGETTFELRDRTIAWLKEHHDGVVVAVTHGGPIAALRGTVQERPVVNWPGLIPKCGEWVEVGVPGPRRGRM
jgi:broad specificity phosphatase PhoE